MIRVSSFSSAAIPLFHGRRFVPSGFFQYRPQPASAAEEPARDGRNLQHEDHHELQSLPNEEALGMLRVSLAAFILSTGVLFAGPNRPRWLGGLERAGLAGRRCGPWRVEGVDRLHAYCRSSQPAVPFLWQHRAAPILPRQVSAPAGRRGQRRRGAGSQT